MKIAIVGPTYPIKGGIAQHTTVLAHRLVAAGHDTRIVSWQRQYPDRLYPGVQTVAAPELPPFAATERTLAWNRPDSWVRAALKLRAVDLVIFVHVTPVQVPAYWTMLHALGGSTGKVVLCHNVLPHERTPFDVTLVRRLLQAADAVVVHSEPEAAIARPLTTKPVVVAAIAPFLPSAFVSRRPRPGVHRRVIFFGIVRPYKGLDVLLRALARGPVDVQLRVAGEVWGDREALEDLCGELGIAARVEWQCGYVAAEDVPTLFADVDALVLPYRSATGSQASWTGFEFGVPVIVTRAGELAAAIRDGVDGIVVDPDDVGSLADGLNRFYLPGTPERLRSAVRPVDADPYWERYLDVLVGAATDASARPALPRERGRARYSPFHG